MNTKNKNYKINQLQQKKPHKRPMLIAAVTILSIIIAVVLLEKTGVTDFYQKPKTEAPAPTENTINYDPPTEQEVTAGNIQKDEIINQPDSQPAKQATVVIVDASQYDNEIEVRAFVSNIVNDGICKFTFTKNGSTTVVKTTQAYADASSTPCIALTIPLSEFSTSGNWDLTVTYSNDTATGSANRTLEIQ